MNNRLLIQPKISGVLLLVVALLGMSGRDAVAASPRDTQDTRGVHQEMHRFSPEQEQKMRAVQEDARRRAHAISKAIQQKRQELMNYSLSPSADSSAALKMHREVSRLQQELGELRVSTWFKMREMMTPEQLDQYVRNKRQMMAQKARQRRGQDDQASRNQSQRFSHRRGGNGYAAQRPGTGRSDN